MSRRKVLVVKKGIGHPSHQRARVGEAKSLVAAACRVKFAREHSVRQVVTMAVMQTSS